MGLQVLNVMLVQVEIRSIVEVMYAECLYTMSTGKLSRIESARTNETCPGLPGGPLLFEIRSQLLGSCVEMMQSAQLWGHGRHAMSAQPCLPHWAWMGS